MKPWSGNNVLVSQTKPIKSSVVNRTIPHITNAIFICWIKVTIRNTTAKAKSRFYIATDLM